MSQSLAFSSPHPFVSSSRSPRNLEDPLLFSEDYELLTSWYNVHRSAGSTTIQRVQLRKEHDSPFHEFVMLLTEAGHIYRVDRGREGPILATLREQGVLPVDTIALLHLASLEQLDSTSYCAIELGWGFDSEKTIDLKLVLHICFQIHNNSGKRYRLLTHNCYFFAQTIIMITARQTMICKLDNWDVLKDMLMGDMLWDVVRNATMTVITQTALELQQSYAGQKVQQMVRLVRRMWTLPKSWWKHPQRPVVQESEQVQEWELQQVLGRALVRVLELELERGPALEGVLEGMLKAELKWTLKVQLDLKQGRDRWDQEQEQAWVREQVRAWVRAWVWAWVQVRALEQAQVRAREWGKQDRVLELKLALLREREVVRRLVQALVQALVPVLAWELREWEQVQDQVWDQMWEQVWEWVQEWVQGLEQERVREHEQELEQVGKGELGKYLGEQLGLEIGKQLGLELGKQLEITLCKELAEQVGKQLGRHLGKHLGEALQPQFVLCLMLLHLHQQRQLQEEGWYSQGRLVLLQLYEQVQLQQQPEWRLQEQFQHLCKLECEQGLVLFQKALIEVLRLGLIGELEPDWHRKCNEIMLAAQADVSSHGSMWAKWLIENLGKIIIHALQQEPLVGCSFSWLLGFPVSFSASSKINAKAPNVTIKKFRDLEDYMKGIIERHVESVPPGVGSREELRAEILNGMTATWHLVSPQFQHEW